MLNLNIYWAWYKFAITFLYSIGSRLNEVDRSKVWKVTNQLQRQWDEIAIFVTSFLSLQMSSFKVSRDCLEFGWKWWYTLRRFFDRKCNVSSRLWWRPVCPDWAIYCTLGNFSKPVATIILAKSPTFLGNFCKCVKIFHFSSEIICRQFL